MESVKKDAEAILHSTAQPTLQSDISSADSPKKMARLLIIESVRLGILVSIFLIFLFFQLRQPEFTSLELILPVYILLTASFFFNAIYIFFFGTLFGKIWFTTAFLFLVDSVFVTGLILMTGVDHSIFLFIYLVNISLCGFVYQRRGAFSLALITSFMFSLILILGPEFHGQSLYFILGLNNLAFFAVAFLSGYLSEQLNFMGVALTAREAQIKSLQDLNQLVVDNISTGIVTIDVTGKILQANRAALNILERSSSDIVNHNVLEILPDFKVNQSVTEHLENKVELGRFELSYATPTGEKLILGMSVSPLLNLQNIFDGSIIIFQDLTQIKRLERAVRRSEKLAAVGQLAAGIAHEIRNPLASISGSVQLLKANIDSTQPDDAKLMAIIIREIDRLNRLIADFLEFVRPDVQADEAVNIVSLVKEVLDMVKMNTSVRQDVKQILTVTTSSLIPGHPDKLKQVVLNLVLNAYQAMQNVENPTLNVTIFETDLKVVMRIRDNGAGMSESVVNRLFEPFYTTKPNGTGLGLATVHKILENHSAEIFVDSKPGAGSEFAIEFARFKKDQKSTSDHDRIESEKLVIKYQEEMNKFNLRKRGHG